MAKEILDGGLSTYKSEELAAYSAGFVAAFVVGLVACTWMISLVKKSQLKYFSYYCFVVGLIAIVHEFVAV